MTVLIPDKNFFSIKETSKITQVKPYILRFWEQKFNLLNPLRRPSGHRKYTKKDIDLIFQIKDLLYNKHHTIEGAKKILSSQKREKNKQLKFELGENPYAIELLKEIKKELEELLRILK